MSCRPEVTRGRRLATVTPPTNEAPASAPALNADILWGAQAIADHIGRSLRETFHLLQQGYLDADKFGPEEERGGRWVSTRSRLDRQFQGSRRAAS
jgi:hypothetical protein